MDDACKAVLLTVASACTLGYGQTLAIIACLSGCVRAGRSDCEKLCAEFAEKHGDAFDQLLEKLLQQTG